MSFYRPMAALCALLLTGGQGFAGPTGKDIGEAFCQIRLKQDEKALRPLLTASLLKVIDEAQARNDVIAKADPDEKPPFGDGIPYQSFPDSAPLCKVGEAKDVPGRVEVPITYDFPETPDADWTDTLVLVSAGGKLLIDDIRFETSVNDTDEISLRRVLFDAFDQ
jgi:hypothetical protein